jgi:hypothetical protein
MNGLMDRVDVSRSQTGTDVVMARTLAPVVVG